MQCFPKSKRNIQASGRKRAEKEAKYRPKTRWRQTKNGRKVITQCGTFPLLSFDYILSLSNLQNNTQGDANWKYWKLWTAHLHSTFGKTRINLNGSWKIGEIHDIGEIGRNGEMGKWTEVDEMAKLAKLDEMAESTKLAKLAKCAYPIRCISIVKLCLCFMQNMSIVK